MGCMDPQLPLIWKPAKIYISTKSHNASITYPTTHQSEQNCAYFGALWVMAQMHCGIWGIGSIITVPFGIGIARITYQNMWACVIMKKMVLFLWHHNDDVVIRAMASQITSLTIVYLTVYSGADQRKHQSSASLAFVWGIHQWPVNVPHQGPVTRKKFPFDDVIMTLISFR